MILSILYLISNFTLGWLFFLSMLDKLMNKSAHLSSFEKYILIPKWGTKIAYISVILFELYLTIIFTSTKLTSTSIFIFIVGISIFNIAILVNLLNGKVNMSCGCGGVLESETLNFKMIIRNICFIFFAIFILTLKNNFTFISFSVLQKGVLIFISIKLILIFIILKELKVIKLSKQKLSRYLFLN
ncbi:MauE/DoxX family redox-associated membrane protein [Cytobacillus kochii]|uniref:MauE/DoxX family redox-associated membrane protein n=1 Tax=Cytobacillus kochii TaxID=859143 RepID=UPI00203EC8C1|nr:MauE/DoxX family redox-associated membrane protein [Cytobacillus kochii]MCM3324818.1 hypothetical protein [Cytobacillus kochii]MCM3347211.1 hypothetical protein [Cytobacillus kochii]